MRYLLLLALCSLSLSARAEDGLLKVPESAIDRSSLRAGGTPVRGNPALEGRTIEIPDSVVKDGSAKAYEDFFFDRILRAKKEAMTQQAVRIAVRPMQGVRCLPEDHEKSKFGFQRVSEMDYKMNCHAGVDDKVTDVAEFRWSLNYSLPSCPLEKDVRAYFADGKNRTRANAQSFYANRMFGCIVMAISANTMNPVVSIVPVKASYASDGNDEPSPAVVSRSSETKRSPSRTEAESEEPIRRRPKPACAPGSLFCKERSAD